MGFLAFIPAILQLLNKVLPNKEDQDAAKAELLKMIEENRYKELELDTQDRVSARDMYTQTKDRIVPILAWTIVIGFFLLCAALFIFTIPVGLKDVVLFVAGQLAGAFTMVLSFYFGSSASSRNKDIALQDGLTDLVKEKKFKIKD